MPGLELVVVGGFLGSGKTTLLLRVAQLLTEKGNRVALIANDQAANLIDTALMRGAGFSAGEVAGGCFCCRFDDLLSQIRDLWDKIRPDIILAEPVGSCTDLAATIFQPVQRYYQEQLWLAPLTVVVDPLQLRALRRENVLPFFPNDVTYLFRKQLEEADIIVLNKIDLLEMAVVSDLVGYLEHHFPQARIVPLSATTGAGVPDLLPLLRVGDQVGQHILDIDYAIYTSAEACLGWVNATGHIQAASSFQPHVWLESFMADLSIHLQRTGREAAHVKLRLLTASGSSKANLVGLSHSSVYTTEKARVSNAQLLVNARLNADPLTARQLVQQAIHTADTSNHVVTELAQTDAFSPLPPRPTYRLTTEKARA